MSGLYKRALTFLKQSFTPLPETSSQISFDEESGIPIEEQKEIITQIESVVAENRIKINQETLELHPEKNGAVVLVTIWIVAIVLAVVGYFGFQTFFYTQQQNELEQNVGSQMNEEFLRTLRKQSEQKLTQAEENIKALQGQISDFEAQKANLEENMQAQIDEAKKKLEEDMEADIQAELQRLRDAGQQIDAEAEEQIREQRSAEYEELLAQAQAQAEQDKKEAEDALNQALQSINSELSQSNKEKADLQTELEDVQKQQEELEKELEEERKANAEKAAKSSEAAKEAEARLAELREKQRQENLLVDNILTQYDAIQEFVAQRNFPKALETVGNIRNIYKTADVVAFENLKKRQQIDLFLAGFIEDSIKDIQASSQVDTENLLAQSKIVNTMSSKIADANQSYQKGDFTAAKELYTEALSLLPEMKVGYDNLKNIEGQSENNEFKSMAYNANLAYVKGDYSQAVEYYEKAIKTFPVDSGDVDTMITRMLESGYQIKGDDSAVTKDDNKAQELLYNASASLQNKKYIDAINTYISLIQNYPRSKYVESAKNGVQSVVKAQNELITNESGNLLKEYSDTISQKNKQINQFESDINSKDQEIASLKNQIELNAKTISSQSSNATEFKQVEANLRKQITDLEYEISLLENQVASLEKREPAATAEPVILTPEPIDIGSLAVNTISEETQEKLTDYSNLKNQIEELKAKYKIYREQEDEIYEQLGPIGLISTKPLLGDALNQNLAKEIFPDLYSRINRFNDALYNDAKQLGSEDAIETILSIIKSRQRLSASDTSSTYWQQIKTQYQNDDYLLNAINELEKIMK